MSRDIVGAWTDQSGNIRAKISSGSSTSFGSLGCGKGDVISFNSDSITYKDQNNNIRQYNIKTNSYKYLGKSK